jgi:Trp operon repressor
MDIDEIPRTLDERRTADGKRKLMLTEAERESLVQNQLIERAVSLYLDLEEARSQRDIADELGLTVKQLKYMTQSEQFKEKYEEYFSELGHDPRLKATRAGLVDLLPLAYSRFRGLLESTQTPATVLLKAVEKVLELNGVQQQVGKVSDRKELAEFLGGANLTQINITVNEEYQEALEDVIDGQLVSERIQSAE